VTEEDEHAFCEQCGDCIVCEPDHYCDVCKGCRWACGGCEEEQEG
jgi:hypothetical protein